MTKYNNKLLLFLVFTLMCNMLHAQQIDVNKQISIKVKNKPLSEILKEITSKSGIMFSYSSNIIPENTLISIKAKEKPVKEILNEIANNVQINWQIVENQIVLKPIQNIQTNRNSKEKFTISGYIKDKKTGEYLPGASVYIPNTNIGTVSNSYGFYSLTLPKGNYQLAYSYIGYNIMNINVVLNENKIIESILEQEEIALVEIEVKANDVVSDFNNQTSGTMTVSPSLIRKKPAPMGEPEIIKTLQTFPGVISGGDASVYYFVRGGQKDQNLILIDEAPVYNPSHLLGLFSSFVPEAVKSFTFYKSSMPAKFGGRLSSVLDIVTNDGNKNKFSGNVSLGVAASHIQLEGPLKKDKSSWFVSLRRSNIGWLFKRQEQNFDINFTDFNTKTNLRLGKNDRLFLSFYIGKDNFLQTTAIDKYGLEWSNVAGTVRWNHLYNEKLFANTTLYTSKYNYNFYLSQKNGTYWNTYIQTLGIKHDITFYKSPQNTFNLGLGIAVNSENPGNIILSNANSKQIIPVIEKCFNNDIWVYFENERKINRFFELNYGLRLPFFLNNGPTKEYFFDENFNNTYSVNYETKKVYNYFVNPEPRVLLKYKPDTFFNVSTSYTHTVQYLRQLGTSQSPFTSLEVWYPSSPGLKPETADQISVSFAKLYVKHDIELNVETYYKWMHNVTDYSDHADLLINPLIKGELRLCEGNSYGVEFSVRKNSRKITYWLGYIYSRSFLQSPDINNGVKYTAYYDHPHTVNFNLHFQAKPRIALSSNWIYSTGSPYTAPTSFYYYQGDQIPVYVARNNMRLPDYHRLDINMEFILNKLQSKSQHKLTFTIYNAYNRHNPFSLNFNKIVNDANHYVIPQNTNSTPETISTYKYIFGIVPSVTYLWQF